MPYGKMGYIAYGLEFVDLKRENRPPYIFMGMRRVKEERPCLAFYVDRDMKGPYWPDESGRMVRNNLFDIDFSNSSKESVRIVLRRLTDEGI